MDPPKQAVCRISGIFGQIGGAGADFTQHRAKSPPFGGPHRQMCIWTKFTSRQRGGILRGRKPEPALKLFFTDMFTPYKP